MATSIVIALIGAAATAASTASASHAAKRRAKQAREDAKKQNVLAATQQNIDLAGAAAGDEQKALQSIMGKVKEIS